MNGVNPKAEWSAIAARIAGMEQVAGIYAAYLGNSSAKSLPGADKLIFNHCVQIVRTVQKFREDFLTLISREVLDAIQRFEVESADTVAGGFNDSNFIPTRVFQLQLIALSSEVTYLLNDSTETVRRSAEIAFMHLQRQIVADPDCRARWIAAFDTGETSCEKLGGVHLLWHGILAFKTDGQGGRSDLVFPESLKDRDVAAAQGLVLTEWKKSTGNGEKDFAAAKRQTNGYASGILGGVELQTHRYLIVVTKKQITVPADERDNDITYRHINLAVDPDTPSKAALRP